MSTKWVKKDNALIVKADGHSVGIQEAREYLSEIKDSPHHYGFLIFDFSDVTEITSAALRNLTFAASSANQMNAKVAVVGAALINKCIADCGLEKLFPYYSSIDQAFQTSSSSDSLRRDLIESLEDAVKTTFQNIASSQAEILPIDFEKQDHSQDFEIGAVVGIIDRSLKGSLIIGFSIKTFLSLMSKMFGESYTSVTDDISDGPAEVLNMILGHLKIALNDKGFGITQAIPTTVKSSNLRIVPNASKKESSSIILLFQSEFGNFYVEFNTNFQSLKAAA